MKKVEQVAWATLLGMSMTLASPALSETILVSRCNVLSDNVFKPALIVTANGTRHVFVVGQEGLTRRAVYNAALSVEFVSRTLGIGLDGLSYADCSDGFAGNVAAAGGGPDNPAPPPVVVTPPPPPPPPPPPTGGCGGCGSCYAI